MYERLVWITFYAPIEQIDTSEIDDIVERLDKLDPLKADSLEVDVETASQIFRDRYYNIYKKCFGEC